MTAESVLATAVQYARQILSGEITPYQGGRLIWMECQIRLANGDHRLDPFVYWASEREEASDPDRSALCDHALRTAAATLIERGTAL